MPALSQSERDRKLSDAFWSEMQRRLEKEPEKIPGSILPRLADYFADYEERERVKEERERAALEQAQEDPLSMILIDGLPLERKNAILLEYTHELRRDLDQAERALQDLNRES